MVNIEKGVLLLIISIIGLAVWTWYHIPVEFYMKYHVIFAISYIIIFIYLYIRGRKIRAKRFCIECDKPLKKYSDTIYSMRWNSGRKPTPLFFCYRCAKEIKDREYSGQRLLPDEKKKTSKELYTEMLGQVKKESNIRRYE